VAINGQEASRGTGLKRPRGYIGWQAEGFPLEISDIWVMELSGARTALPFSLAQLPPPLARSCSLETLWRLFVR
jgi:hypothetical protein